MTMVVDMGPYAVLRIRDVYPGYEFFHPSSRIQGQTDSESRIRTKKFKYF